MKLEHWEKLFHQERANQILNDLAAISKPIHFLAYVGKDIAILLGVLGLLILLLAILLAHEFMSAAYF